MVEDLRPTVDARDEQHQLAFRNAPIGIAVVALDGRFARVNAALARILGHPEEVLRSTTFQEITHPDDLDVDLALLERLVAGRIDTYQMEKRYRRADGSYVWANLSVSVARSGAGQPQYFIAHVEDISRRVTACAAVEHYALHDPLTDLANHRYLLQRLQEALRPRRPGGTEVGVVVAAVDQLGTVNDVCGPEVGDRVLVEAAQRLRSLVRAGDTAARLGGSKLAVVRDDVADRVEVFELVEALRRAEPPALCDELATPSTLSIGAAFSGSDAPSPGRLLHRAVRDMRRDRQERRGGIRGRNGGRIRLVIADEAEVVRVGLVALFADVGDLSVMAAVRDGAAAEVAVASTNPDVVVIGMRLPDVDGIQLWERLRTGRPALTGIVLSAYVDQAALARADQAGIRAYLTKDVDGDVLVDAVRQVAAGVRVDLVDDHLRKPPELAAERHLAVLSPRELEVAYLVAEGLTNRQIAEELGLTEKTTKNYLTRIFQKLGVRNRAGVLRLAIRARQERGRSPTPPLPRTRDARV